MSTPPYFCALGGLAEGQHYVHLQGTSGGSRAKRQSTEKRLDGAIPSLDCVDQEQRGRSVQYDKQRGELEKAEQRCRTGCREARGLQRLFAAVSELWCKNSPAIRRPARPGALPDPAALPASEAPRVLAVTGLGGLALSNRLLDRGLQLSVVAAPCPPSLVLLRLPLGDRRRQRDGASRT